MRILWYLFFFLLLTPHIEKTLYCYSSRLLTCAELSDSRGDEGKPLRFGTILDSSCYTCCEPLLFPHLFITCSRSPRQVQVSFLRLDWHDMLQVTQFHFFPPLDWYRLEL